MPTPPVTAGVEQPPTSLLCPTVGWTEGAPLGKKPLADRGGRGLALAGQSRHLS